MLTFIVRLSDHHGPGTDFIPLPYSRWREPILARTRSENIIGEILDSWRRGTRGPLPQLTPNQLLNALVLIDREGPLGRRALAHALQIKDGVARGLMERLAQSRIARVNENGVRLSNTGRKKLHAFLRHLSIRKILPLPESDLIVNSQAMGVHLARAYRPDITGVPQRDEAIRAGAEGAITVATLRRKLVIPPDNRDLADLAPKENVRLRSELKLSDKDLIIIGFGKDASRALAGALAVVFSFQV